MIYKCNNCKQEFGSSMIVEQVGYEFHSEVDTRQYETITSYQCPYCRSIDIDEYFGEEDEDGDSDEIND